MERILQAFEIKLEGRDCCWAMSQVALEHYAEHEGVDPILRVFKVYFIIFDVSLDEFFDYKVVG